MRVVSHKRATTTAEGTSRKACAKTPSRTERAGRANTGRKTGDARGFFALFMPSLSLYLGLPHRRSRSVFFEEFFWFVVQALISFVGNFRHYSKTIGKKSTLSQIYCFKFVNRQNWLFLIRKSEKKITTTAKDFLLSCFAYRQIWINIVVMGIITTWATSQNGKKQTEPKRRSCLGGFSQLWL